MKTFRTRILEFEQFGGILHIGHHVAKIQRHIRPVRFAAPSKRLFILPNLSKRNRHTMHPCGPNIPECMIILCGRKGALFIVNHTVCTGNTRSVFRPGRIHT